MSRLVLLICGVSVAFGAYYEQLQQIFGSLMSGYGGPGYSFETDKCFGRKTALMIEDDFISISYYASLKMWDELELSVENLKDDLKKAFMDCDIGYIYDSAVYDLENFSQADWTKTLWWNNVLIYRYCTEMVQYIFQKDFNDSAFDLGRCLNFIFPPKARS